MKRKNIITIANNGEVHIPTTVLMRDFEIAELFGLFQQTVKANIRAILKSGISTGDTSKGGVVVGNSVIPEHFGLDMIIALAFRVQSLKAVILRDYMLSRLTKPSRQPIYVQIGNDSKVDIYS